MNATTTPVHPLTHSFLARRAQAAYAANNIPWDPAIASLPADVLVRTAEYWEARAAGKTPRVETVPDETPLLALWSPKAIKKRLSRYGFNRPNPNRGRTFAGTNKYNGG